MVPDGTLFEPGAKFKKTWTLRNGGQVWPTGLELIHVSGELIPRSSSQLIPAAEPGVHVEISVDLEAPVPTPQTPNGSLSSVWSIVSRTAGGEPETHGKLSAHVTVVIAASPDTTHNPASDIDPTVSSLRFEHCIDAKGTPEAKRAFLQALHDEADAASAEAADSNTHHKEPALDALGTPRGGARGTQQERLQDSEPNIADSSISGSTVDESNTLASGEKEFDPPIPVTFVTPAVTPSAQHKDAAARKLKPWPCGLIVGALIALLSALVAVVFSTNSDPMQPHAKYLIVSSDEAIARRFQREMGDILQSDTFDILCAETHSGIAALFGVSYKFNCASETEPAAVVAREDTAHTHMDVDAKRRGAVEAYVPSSRFRAWLLSYESVFMIESGNPDRLSRSPFTDMMVYKHIQRHNEGSLKGLAAQGLNVTVVLIDVTCEGMSRYMEKTGNPIHLGDCKASDAGRIESFQEKFYRRVAISQGRLDLAYTHVDIEAGLSVTTRQGAL
jgi:hypothetical protein